MTQPMIMKMTLRELESLTVFGDPQGEQWKWIAQRAIELAGEDA